MLLGQRACAAGGHAARCAADQCKEFPAFHKCPQESKLRAVSCHSGPAIGTAGEGPEVRPIVLGWLVRRSKQHPDSITSSFQAHVSA
jgi:hypothetical protein